MKNTKHCYYTFFDRYIAFGANLATGYNIEFNTKRAHATIFTDTPNNAQHELFKTWCISNFTVAGLCNIIRYEI